MDIQTPESEKKLDSRTREYWAERRKHIRPPLKYAITFATVSLVGLAGLWAYGYYAGIRGAAAITGGVLATLVQLMNIREDWVGESRILVVSEVLFLICIAANPNLARTRGAKTPVIPVILIFIGLIILDLGMWSWPFRCSLRRKSWIQR